MKNISLIILFSACIAVRSAETVKVISLSPAVTDMILAIGGRENLAGRSSACDAPQAKNIPVAGDMGKPFTEPVLKSGAKLILSDTRAPGPQWDMLQKCGVRAELLPAGNIDDLPRNIRRIGSLLNRQKSAEKTAYEIESDLAMLRQTPPRIRIKTLIILGLPPVVSCGRNSFMTGALALAGVENIAAAAPGSYFVLNPEMIHAAAPDLIVSFVPPDATEKYFSRAEYRSIPAVKNRKFLYPPIEKLCRLTPELPREVKKLKSAIERDFPQQQP